MPPALTPTFEVEGAFWDEHDPDLMWIVVKSSEDIPGEFALRVFFCLDGEGYPHDEENTARDLCRFDPKHLDDVPEDADEVTTVVRGLRANRCNYGCPWAATKQGIKRDGPRVLFWLQVVPESELNGGAAPAGD